MTGLLSEELTASNDQMVELSSPSSFSVACSFLFPLEKLETVCKIKQRKILFLNITSGEQTLGYFSIH